MENTAGEPAAETLLKHERELSKIVDLELRRLICKKRIFENLNHEKPMKRFLDLAHNIGKGESITNIKHDNGTDFSSERGLENHITNFYSSLYRKDNGISGSIEDFLGPDICNHPMVRNSKLTPEQVTELDSDLEFKEIYKAMMESNAKSAPGMDGYSGMFIKIFLYNWPPAL
jgi:hypothetical protein